MKWLREPATKDFYQGIILGFGCGLLFVGEIFLIGRIAEMMR